MKKYVMLSMVLIVGLLSGCGLQDLQTIGADKYYVQIQDEGEAYTEQDNTRYEYTLNGFDKDGENEEFTFTAGKQLKEDAYLEIYYKNDEVITYEEVEKDDVPEKALQLIEDEDNS